jgi:superfamily II DNA or RNA helicase
MFTFRWYQEKGIEAVAALAAKGIRRIVFQAPTGAGKTVLFAGLTKRFIARYPEKRVLISVHRDALLWQTVGALKNLGIEPGMLIAGYATPVREVNGFMVPYNKAQVIVCMVETLHNRFKKYQNYLGDIGMLIPDECHIANFNKIYDHFPNSLIVGFSATTISADKRKPLKNYFQEIVSPVTIKELIADGYLAQNITITAKGTVSRKTLKTRGDDFDENDMAKKYSTPRHIENCVKNYAKYGMGLKSIVFNCNIEHSKAVADAFVAHGYNARHMDGTATDEQRKDTLKWFAETSDAILCNVDLYTTGFDEPTIINVIPNRATKSLPKWLQMCGRGSRPIPGFKTTFNIIDMGDNVAYHGDWCDDHNWTGYFHYPESVGAKKGGGPQKLCSECDAMVHLSVKICPYCGANLAKEIEYDKAKLELDVLTSGIDIEALIAKNQEYQPYTTLHQIKRNLIARFRDKYKHMTCSQAVRDALNERYQAYVKQWCEQQMKPYNKWHKDTTRKWLMDELNRYFGKVPDHQTQEA